jgi:RNA polymerase sigma-70 factor, ECF subfamily
MMRLAVVGPNPGRGVGSRVPSREESSPHSPSAGSPQAVSATQREPKRSLSPGERERFERTVLPHLRAAYNLARWLTRNQQDAEDVVQEAYLRALKFFGGFRGGDSKAWLLTIVRHASYTAWKQGRGAQATVGLDDAMEDVEDDALGPEDLLLQKASGAAVAEALEELPIEFREALVLRELEGLSYKEMAEVTQLPIGTVMSRLARARKRLRERLQERVRGGPA